ncbi:MAG: cytochrome c biogenesis protein ResB [Acidobacteria bacterium]|nr:cytochrome c biogenesis protein ResB [Acidobacteriota bacterium]
MRLPSFSPRSRSTGWLFSVRTGIVLLISVGLASTAGTLVLQRPQTDPQKLASAYSPEVLAWLDWVGLTDVFHSWWFAAMLMLLSVNLVLASIERFPAAWSYFRRPYRRPEKHYRASLTLQKEILIPGVDAGLHAAQCALRQMGFRPRRIEGEESASLFAERNRFSRLAAYVVHASLLLIFGGALVDAIWGYRGFLALTENEQSNRIELRDRGYKALPFTIRCDGAGQQNYPDGTPRRWWSKLAVIEDGREVWRKEIAVNEPLVYRGLRFFQSGYGETGNLDVVELRAALKSDPTQVRDIFLHQNETLPLDGKSSVTLAAFYPDFVLIDGEARTRSQQPINPAIQLKVQSVNAGEQPVSSKVWLFPNYPAVAHPDGSPFSFEFRDLKMGYFTALQVSYEPGQWAVWAGIILMGIGLGAAFYFVHVRVWAVPVLDGRGRMVLWVGASASKDRNEFKGRFEKLVRGIEDNLNTKAEARMAWFREAAPAKPRSEGLIGAEVEQRVRA